MRSLWTFFSSVKLAIALLILLAAALVIGTLIPQGESSAFYAARFGGSASLLMGLRLTGLFHSVWFLALLALFAVNTIVCTVARLPAKWRRAFHPQVEAEPAGLLAFRVKGRITRNQAAPEVRARLEALLASRHYHIMSREGQNGLILLARKKGLGHFGSDFVHLGLLVVIAGGIVSGLAGFRTRISLEEGQTALVPQAGIELRLDKFETEYYPQGDVKAWKSTITILENKAPVRTREIAVNKPLSHRGFSFYQMSYGWNWDNPRLEITVKKKSDPAFSSTVQMNMGERVPFENKGPIRISVRRFVPDFILGEGNEVQSRSEEPNNPAAQVEAWKGDERVFSGWVFAKYPDFEQMHSGQPTELSFSLTSYHAAEYSVIEAARDPGVGWIWTGCLLVSAGVFLAFYWPPREIRVILEPSRDRTEVTAGGQAAKNRESFKAEFESILDSLRRSS